MLLFPLWSWFRLCVIISVEICQKYISPSHDDAECFHCVGEIYVQGLQIDENDLCNDSLTVGLFS